MRRPTWTGRKTRPACSANIGSQRSRGHSRQRKLKMRLRPAHAPVAAIQVHTRRLASVSTPCAIDWRGLSKLYRAAFHEAGHAIAAFHYRRPIRLIRIDREGEGGTYCQALQHGARSSFRRRVWRTLVQQEICICLAGPIAEEIAHGKNAESAEIDLQHAHEWLRELMAPDDGDLVTFASRTRELLTEPQTWNAVHNVARRLMQVRWITGADVNTVCHALKVPRVKRSYQKAL
jgi:Peptidase family M41